MSFMNRKFDIITEFCDFKLEDVCLTAFKKISECLLQGPLPRIPVWPIYCEEDVGVRPTSKSAPGHNRHVIFGYAER